MPENTPRFEGEEIQLGGEKYIVPALSLGQVKRLEKELESLFLIEGMPTPEQIDNALTIFLAAINRNYPAMTLEDLLDLVDTGNLISIMKAVMRTSGLVGKGEGKA
jgi:hypothetical protein